MLLTKTKQKQLKDVCTYVTRFFFLRRTSRPGHVCSFGDGQTEAGFRLRINLAQKNDTKVKLRNYHLVDRRTFNNGPNT